jgi:hypothetical protein
LNRKCPEHQSKRYHHHLPQDSGGGFSCAFSRNPGKDDRFNLDEELLPLLLMRCRRGGHRRRHRFPESLLGPKEGQGQGLPFECGFPPFQLLPTGFISAFILPHAVHPLRHRGGALVSVGSCFQDSKLVRLLSILIFIFVLGVRLRLAKGSISMGVAGLNCFHRFMVISEIQRKLNCWSMW